MEGTAFWTGRRFAGFVVVLFAIPFLYYGGRRLLEGDQLIQETASPDGAVIARLWCQGPCWRAWEVKILTVSPASRHIDLQPMINHDSDVIVIPPNQEGRIPQEDVAARMRWAGYQPTSLRWVGPRMLIVIQTCLTDEDWNDLPPTRMNGVLVGFARVPLPPSLRAFHGIDASGRDSYLDEATARCAARRNNG